jgi:hypothetical protein
MGPIPGVPVRLCNGLPVAVFVGTIGKLNISLLKPLDHINDPAALVVDHLYAGGFQRFKGIGTAVSRQQYFCVLITDHGGCLNTRAFKGIFIVIIIKGFKLKGFRVYNENIRSPSESGVQLGIQGFSLGCDSYFHFKVLL